MNVAPPKDVNSSVPSLTSSVSAFLASSMLQAQTVGYVPAGQHLALLLEELDDLVLFSSSVDFDRLMLASSLYHLNVGVDRKVSDARVKSSIS